MYRQTALGLTLAMLVQPALAQDTTIQPEETTALTEQQAVTAQNYMVAAANPLAVQAGYDVLAAGGSAADAAVAVQMMLNLVEPQSSGIGGGAFLVFWDASQGRLTTLDGREKAPMAATPDYWLGQDGEPVGFWDAVIGGRSVGVPGTLALLDRLHAQHGRTPWADLMQPAITTAEDGFAISPRMADSIAGAMDRSLDLFPETAAYFFHEDGTPRAAGETLTNPAFARTLRLIAAEGIAPFYTGAIAGDIVAAVRTDTNPGIMTMQDLAEYEVIERNPVCVLYRTHEVCGMGPPSSGALTVGQMLGVLDNFDLSTMSEADAWHHYIEAARLSYADRGKYMADSDFVSMPTEGLIDPDYLSSRADLIDPTTTMGQAQAGTPAWDETRLWSPDVNFDRPGTSHMVIVDSYGDMVSMTTTIETGFGSRVMTGGFLLNNEMTDFSFRPEGADGPVANRVEAGKRPRSSMAPTIVLTDGQPSVLIGSPGGSRIINYVAGSLVRMIDMGMDPQSAINAGHIVNRNGATDLEEGTEAENMAEALAGFDQETTVRNLNSGLHVITIAPDGTLTGAADPRREGAVMGD
ncbi:gamma-glutamyltranspeptidase / glutathione hydrolase [Monaibacterium marinum]|uniref:Glutathione hydrolase proenzyme n=1 Tax=Pontivivens marinum TaxID=1690039 RepID=A0A2C9CW26_9RHOB|nr:gamma-glutamyltransferase [Monaibacterium marinum]SOH95315.1 gamma-glutamyltranspeptidase / glutathione hydrolase [Monaibacterium marinum]